MPNTSCPMIRDLYWKAVKKCMIGAFLVAVLAAMTLLSAGPAWAQSSHSGAQSNAEAKAKAKAAARAKKRAATFSHLMAQVDQLREKEADIAAHRQHEARQKLHHQQQLLQQAVARRNAAKARGNDLEQTWDANAAHIKDLRNLLSQQQGNLGELFGVVRQVAADASETFKNSLLTTQFEPTVGDVARTTFLTRLAKGHAIPSIHDLHRLWYELLREIVADGNVVRYKTNVMQVGKLTGGKPEEVVRVGPFTAVNGNEYLDYLSSAKSLTELKGQLPASYRETAYHLTHAAPDSGYTSAVVDVSGGGILGMYLSRPNWLERVQLGETVGYVIIAVALLGLLVALVQYIYLALTRRAMNRQFKELSNPRTDNPLGRLLLTFKGHGKQPPNAEVAELRLSEAVMQEVPGLERFQSFLQLAVAAGPLLGLIGTVTGMIITFHAIVAAGTSDPTIMAKGIGHAMIATVLGLGTAIPLLFLNTGLKAFSGRIIQTLEEYSQSLLADRLKSDDAAKAEHTGHGKTRRT